MVVALAVWKAESKEGKGGLSAGLRAVEWVAYSAVWTVAETER